MTLAEKAELASLVVGSIVALLGGKEAIAHGLKWWAQRKVERDAAVLGAQKEIALARIQAEQSDADREERTVDRLWDRMDRQDRRLEECEKKHADSERRNDECEERGRVQAEAIESLQAQVKRQNDTIGDLTGRVRTEVRKVMSDPRGIPAQPGNGHDK